MKRTIAMLLLSIAVFFACIAFVVSLMGIADKETAAMLNGFAIGALIAGPCGAICVYLALMQLDETPKPTQAPPVVIREPIIVIVSPVRAGNQAEVIDAVVRYAGSYSRAMELWQTGKVTVIQ